MDERIPAAQGSCIGNISDDDWVNPDDPDDSSDGDDDNNGGGDGDGDDGNNSGDDGNDGNDSGDDGNSNEAVEAIIQEAKEAASEAENLLAGAQSTLNRIRSSMADLEIEFEKAQEADDKVIDAVWTSEEYLY